METAACVHTATMIAMRNAPLRKALPISTGVTALKTAYCTVGIAIETPVPARTGAYG